jgi:hypothetical protein
MTDKIPMKDPYIIVKWHVSDINHAANYLSHKQQMEVLEYVYKNHNCEHGINWQLIENAVDTLFWDIKWDAIAKAKGDEDK